MAALTADVLAYKTKLAVSALKKTQFPNQGGVTAVLQAEAYTYLEVVNDNREVIWLAGPKLAVQAGDRVGYSKGVLMGGFYSKELQRSFDAILFVGQLQKIE